MARGNKWGYGEKVEYISLKGKGGEFNLVPLKSLRSFRTNRRRRRGRTRKSRPEEGWLRATVSRATHAIPIHSTDFRFGCSVRVELIIVRRRDDGRYRSCWIDLQERVEEGR